MKKIMALVCASLMAVTLLTGCSLFGAEETETVNVQSVSMICGFESTVLLDRFAGIVSSRGEAEVKADSEKTIKEFLVKEDDEVTAGQVLFTYDVELAELELEKAELELQQMNANLEAKKQAKASLEKEKAKAKAEEQLSYLLEIQQCDAEIREQEYNITLKEKEIARMQEQVGVTECTAPISGRVSELNENGDEYDTSGNLKPTVTIVEAGAYRVKGYVNEQNVSAFPEGTPVSVRSRVDDSVWSGYVSLIDWENPKSGSSSDYYYYEDDSEMSSSSSYPFYVELDDSEGLLLGQHVYIEPDYGQGEEAGNVIELGSYYLVDPDGSSASVWAEENGVLALREVSLGDYDEYMDSYVITEGLSEDDYIAIPEDGLKAGMICVEYDESAFDTGVYDEDVYYEEDIYYEEDGYDGGVYYEEGGAVTGNTASTNIAW